MRKYLFLLLMIPMLSFNSDSVNIDIVGKWMAEENEAIGSITFDSEGFAFMEFNGEKMGGKNFLMNNVNAKMTYSFNSDKDPMELDIIISNQDDEVLRSMYSIVKIKDKNNIKLAASFDSPTRPTEFTDNNTIKLTRVK